MGNISSIQFRDCSNLDTLASGGIDAKTVCRSNMFENCGITSIPPDLFINDDGTSTSAAALFGGCSNLTSIPSGLFDNNTLATNFNSTFKYVPFSILDNITQNENTTSTIILDNSNNLFSSLPSLFQTGFMFL